jgi:protein-glutamine gamma-glutamyltransferase
VAASVPNPLASKGAVPDDIERFFQVSLYLLLVTAFFTLVTTGKLDSFSMMIVAVALLFRGYLISKNREIRIPERWTSLLTIAYVIFYAADYTLISHNDFVTASVHLVLFVIVVKMFSIHRERDYVYLTVLAFLAVLSAAILTVDALFFGAFTFFVLIAVATFISMEMRRSARTASNLDLSGLRGSGLNRTHGRRVGVHVSLSVAAFILVTAIMFGSVLLFFAMPRISGGYLSHLAQQNSLTTGFSDSVSLGEIGRIQQSSQVVMHVRVEEQAPGSSDLKFRGVALSNFNGSRWSNNVQEAQIMHDTYGRYDLQSVVSRPPEDALFARNRRSRPLRYRIDLEPLGTNVVFLTSGTRYITGRFREIAVDSGMSVTDTDSDRLTGVYSALSEITPPSDRDLRFASGEYPPAIAQRYLQLPDNIDPRIAKFAADITADAPTAFDKSIAIENHLKTRFGYTLQLLDQRRTDQLANFLFERRKGHCEYFATAMAVMLRTQGIPSRVITGFRGGEFNNLTGDYIVRASDAHSWVEAYFPGQGWASFDPTPADTTASPTSWKRMLLYMDAMREFWREWVVNYDFVHQQALGNTALVKGRHTLDEIKDWFRHRYDAMLDATRRASQKANIAPGRYAGYILGAVVLLFALIASPRLVRSWKRSRIARHPERQPSSAASIWYQRLTGYLGRRGWRKHQVQTPAEYASTITDPLLRDRVQRFTAHYERARFGSSAPDAAQLPAIYEEITAKK